MLFIVCFATLLLWSWYQWRKRRSNHDTPVEQMYVVEIDFRDSLTLDRMINLIFTEFFHKKIEQLEKLEACDEKMEVHEV